MQRAITGRFVTRCHTASPQTAPLSVLLWKHNLAKVLLFDLSQHLAGSTTDNNCKLVLLPMAFSPDSSELLMTQMDPTHIGSYAHMTKIWNRLTDQVTTMDAPCEAAVLT